MPDAEKAGTTMRAPGWAVLLCVALLLEFAAVGVFSMRDRKQISSLESWEEPTGVGDRQFFQMPAVLDPKMPLANFGRIPLGAQASAPVQMSDPQMKKAGLDDTRSFFIYYSEENQAAIGGSGRKYFLKISNGQYLPVSPTAN